MAFLPTVSSKPSSNLRILARFAGLWVVGWLASIALGVISNTDSALGAMIGAFEGVVMAFFYVGISLVAGEVGARLGRAIGFQGGARTFALGVSLLWIGIFSFAVWDRLHPERSLKRWTGVSFPAGAVVQKSTQTTGGLADDRYTFVFTCDPSETERLIRDLKLKGEPLRGDELEQWPEIIAEGWKPAERWQRFDEKGSPHYLELIADQSRRKVYLVFGQI